MHCIDVSTVPSRLSLYFVTFVNVAAFTPSITSVNHNEFPPLFIREQKLFTHMNNFFLLLLESSLLGLLNGLLITIYGLRHAPVGFQHYGLFYYGPPPAGLIPVESADSVPHPSDWC